MGRQIHLGLLLLSCSSLAMGEVRLASFDLGLGASVDAYEHSDKNGVEDEVAALYSIKAKVRAGQGIAAALEGIGECCDDDWFNLKQLNLGYTGDNLRLLVGYDVLRWGKASLYSPLDSVNAVDYREDITGQQKRGQFIASIKASEVFGGTTELVVVPDSQDDEMPEFTTGVRQRFVKYQRDGDTGGAALRYSTSVHGYHLGVSVQDMVVHQRQVLGVQLAPDHVALLTSRPRARFAGFELQKDLSSALILSLDAAYGDYQLLRDGVRNDYHAYALGLDYTLPLAFSDEHVANLVLERHYDSRDALAPTFYQNDWYLGATYAFNDVANTVLRAGVVKDIDYRTGLYTLSVARQFLDGKAQLTLKYFAVHGSDPLDKVYLFREFNGTRLEVLYLF